MKLSILKAQPLQFLHDFSVHLHIAERLSSAQDQIAASGHSTQLKTFFTSYMYIHNVLSLFDWGRGGIYLGMTWHVRPYTHGGSCVSKGTDTRAHAHALKRSNLYLTPHVTYLTHPPHTLSFSVWLHNWSTCDIFPTSSKQLRGWTETLHPKPIDRRSPRVA